MNIIDMYLEEITPSPSMIRHSKAAKTALMLKDLEKIGSKSKLSGGFKAVAPKLKKKSKMEKLKDFINTDIKELVSKGTKKAKPIKRS